jgi:hypothetical protein
MNKRLGCLSPLAIISSFITVIAIIAFEVFSGNGMFSAGSLNARAGRNIGGVTSHAEIGSDCAKCHPAPWDSDYLGDRCVQCHADVGKQFKDNTSLHGALKGENPVLNCRECHTEHHGPDAKLTSGDLSHFPHEVTGFPLTAHINRADGARFVCTDCHPDGFTFSPNECGDCHVSYDPEFTMAHVADFSSDCRACHDGVETVGKNFDHNQIKFTLIGKHSDLKCGDCHKNAKSIADLAATPTACESCHQKDDPHEGRFGTVCGDCHNPVGWKDNVKFDHNLADFKLEGEHREVECVECHQDGKYRGTAMTCIECHRNDDEHEGEYGEDCAACHTPNDWDDAEVDHNTFAFVLDGKHTEVACLSCHERGVFKDTPQFCVSCHNQDDAHRGAYGTECKLCHTTAGWKPSTFSHGRTKFPLTGRHSGLSCQSCHGNGVFVGTPIFCAGCHADPAYHRGMFGTSCEQCHNTNNWSANYKGPHPGIADEGGRGVNHGGASCQDCHTRTLREATCTKCHDSNKPGDGGGGGGGDND